MRRAAPQMSLTSPDGSSKTPPPVQSWPAPHSPRAVRPASLREPTLLDSYDSQAELPRSGTFNIDIDANDPYAYNNNNNNNYPAASPANPFNDPPSGHTQYSALPNQEETREHDYVENYLLSHQRQYQSPVQQLRPQSSLQPVRQSSPNGNFYPTNPQGQPVAGGYDAAAASGQPYDDADITEKAFDNNSNSNGGGSKSFNFFSRFTGGGGGGSGRQQLPQDDHDDDDGDAYEDDEKAGGYDEASRHFGPAPLGPQARRNRIKKRVALTGGNLVLDCPIPTRLNSFLPRKDAEEFRFMRYSAITCDPDDFEKNAFTVRPVMSGRDTELCIGVTMYNENEVHFCRTMHAIMKNVSHLCSREKSRTWGKDGWKKVTVVIIADGRKNVHPRVLDVLSAMGVYQPGVAKNIVENDGVQKPVTAHLYEYTAQMSVDPNLSFKGLEKGIVPTQIIFCLKENNTKKINSHRWFFNAFCKVMQPNITVLLDVGTRPGPKSLYHLWKTFDLNSNVGGACGEITVHKGPYHTSLINPLVACQHFEYKMSNILDKPTESLFGEFCYIQVLPGAFSAYRYIALQNDELGRGPLASYFKGENLTGHDADILTANIFLAEDRILCWEIVSKSSGAWVLKYVKSAEGETDVPERASEWISQRRRWLNGSFFAAIYALSSTFNLFKTEHSAPKKFVLFIEIIYHGLNLIFSWFSVANFYIFFIILTSSLEASEFDLKGIKYANMVTQYMYAFTLVATFLFSMGNKPKASEWKYIIAMVIFATLTAYMLFAAAFCFIYAANSGDSDMTFIIFSLIATYGCYVFSSLLALDPWHLITSMPQYLLMQAIYINVLQYAFSNIHDLTWGTKELTEVQTDLGVVRAVSGAGGSVEIILPTDQAAIDTSYDEALIALKTRPNIIPPGKTAAEKEAMKQDYYRDIRSNVLLVYFLTNGILAACVLHGDVTKTFTSDDGSDETSTGTVATRVYMIVILVFVAILSAFRFLSSTAYLVVRLISG